MNDYTSQGAALFLVVAGILVCFWGYRLVKLSLALIGFAVGAYAGWQIGLAVFHGSSEASFVCAVVGGLAGMGLCLWLYFVGVFLIGATAGATLAAVFLNGTGYQVQPIIWLIIPIVFGVLALVAQKLMIALSSAFTGAYFITAGFWSLLITEHKASRIWLDPAQGTHTLNTHGYAALVIWLVLSVLGASFQVRGRHKTAKVTDPQHRVETP